MSFDDEKWANNALWGVINQVQTVEDGEKEGLHEF